MKKLNTNEINEGDRVEVYYDKRIRALNIREKIDRIQNLEKQEETE